MNTITALEPQKNDPRRVNVYLNGEFAFGLSALVAAWLKVGQQLTPEKAAQLQNEEQREQALQRALRSLGRRARSAAELQTSLTRAGFTEDVIEATLARLRELNLLDDAAFARAFVADRQRFHPRGSRMLLYELRNKGIDDATAGTAVRSQVDDDAEAINAALRAVRRYQALPWPEFRQKLGAYLARRGFSWQAAEPAARAAWKHLHPAGSEQESNNNEMNEDSI